MNLTIPLNSHINTADDFIIKDIQTQDKDVLNKKNSLVFKSVLSPWHYKSEAKVYTTSGHTIEKINNTTLQDEAGRTYSVDNSYVIEDTADISKLWSGTLTSAIEKDGYIYSVWQNENDYAIVKSDFDNNIISQVIRTVDKTDLLYYNVKISNFTRKAGQKSSLPYLAEQFVYTTPKSFINTYSLAEDLTLTAVSENEYEYLTGKDLYVLAFYSDDTVKLAVGTDDTDLRKRFTFIDGTLAYNYFGCLGTNGLLTGEPVLTTVSSRNNGKLSDISTTEETYSYLDNGIAYCQQVQGGTDAQFITANASLGTGTISAAAAHTWGSITHTRIGTKAFIAGYDLEAGIPLVLSGNYSNIYPQSGNLKSEIVSLSEAKFTNPTTPSTSLVIEQVDLSDSWGNVTWTGSGAASITNGCNPFPYKYAIMNRAESKGRYWDYGPGWARCYFRQGIIKSYDKSSSAYYRAFAEQFPTSIISFGLSSLDGTNAVRQEYLDPVTLRAATSSYTYNIYTLKGWVHGLVNTGYYYKYHDIHDAESHIWTTFVGADNLGTKTLLDKIPFNVDIIPDLNIKDQYFGLQYMSTSMAGTLLTSASVNGNSNSMIWIYSDSEASLFSNGMIIKGHKNGEVQLEKIADYIYRTNTLTGNNLFIDSSDTFYGQRGFIPYNGEEIITLDTITGKYSPIDDTDTDGNDTYYTASGYNENMTDMKNRSVSYLLPAAELAMIVDSSQVDDLTFQLTSNKKEITKPLLYNQFTYKDEPVDHYYTHTLDSTSIEYQTGKKMESSATGETVYFGIPTYDINKTGFVWYITSSVFFYPLGIGSELTGINYLASTVDMTDDYTVRLYRTQNVTFPVYNPTTEVYKGSTIFTIYGYNYSFDGQSIYYLGSGDTTSESTFACYALGMQFLANSGTEAYFYSAFEKRLYLFTGSNTLQIADKLSREGFIIDSIYSSNEQILYLLTDEGHIIAKSQEDMCLIENVGTEYHFEGTDTGMILANGFNYKKYRLYNTDETEWLPFQYETEYLGNNNSLFKTVVVACTFFRTKADTVTGKFYWDIMHDNQPKRVYSDFTITAKDWDYTNLVRIQFTAPNNVGRAFRFGLQSDDFISVANVMVNTDEASQNSNAMKHV